MKLSVIIPMYNAAYTIEKCLESVLGQSRVDLECIVVDDNSDDESVRIAKGILMAYPKVESKMICLSKNVGPSTARNIALDRIKGDYVTFCDADDWVEENAYEYVIKKMNEENLDIAYYDFYTERRFISERTRIGSRYTDNRKAMNGMVLHERIFDGALWNKMYRTSFLKASGVRFPEGCNAWEDLSFNLRIFAMTCQIGYVKGFLYHHNSYNPQSVVHNWTEQSHRLMMKIKQESEGLRIAEDFLRDKGFLSYIQDNLNIRKYRFRKEIKKLPKEKRLKLQNEIFPEVVHKGFYYEVLYQGLRVRAIFSKLVAIVRSFFHID